MSENRLPDIFAKTYLTISRLPFNIASNKEFNEKNTKANENHTNTPAKLASLRNQSASSSEKIRIKILRKIEALTEIVPAVRQTTLCFSKSDSYSAVYLVTPVLIAPLANVVII